MSIVAHRFGRVEYLLLFSTRKRSWKNQNKYSKFDKFKDINRDITNNSGKISKWKITRRTVVPWFANFPTPIVCFAIFFTFGLAQLAIVSPLLRQFSRFCTDLRILFQRLRLKKKNAFLEICIDG